MNCINIFRSSNDSFASLCPRRQKEVPNKNRWHRTYFCNLMPAFGFNTRCMRLDSSVNIYLWWSNKSFDCLFFAVHIRGTSRRQQARQRQECLRTWRAWAPASTSSSRLCGPSTDKTTSFCRPEAANCPSFTDSSRQLALLINPKILITRLRSVFRWDMSYSSTTTND